MSEAIPKRHRQKETTSYVVLNAVSWRPGDRVLL